MKVIYSGNVSALPITRLSTCGHSSRIPASSTCGSPDLVWWCDTPSCRASRLSLHTSTCLFLLQMVKLRSKLHLSRQGRKSSLSPALCPSPDKCNPNAGVPTQPAGFPSETGLAKLSSSSFPGSALGANPTLSTPGLAALPEELLIKVAAFCDFSDILRLRRSCKVLRRMFDRSLVIEQILLGLVSLPSKFSIPSSYNPPARTLHALHRPHISPLHPLHVTPWETLGNLDEPWSLDRRGRCAFPT